MNRAFARYLAWRSQGDNTLRGRGVWQRNSLSIELRSPEVYQQKLNYIHRNPVKAGISELEEVYKYSSARYYLLNEKNWEFISNAED